MKGLRRFIRSAWLAWVTARAVKRNTVDARAYLTYLSNLCGIRFVGRIRAFDIPDLKQVSTSLFVHLAYSLYQAKKTAVTAGRDADEAIRHVWKEHITKYRQYEQSRLGALKGNPVLKFLPLPTVTLEEHKEIVFEMADKLPVVLAEAQTAFAPEGRAEARISPDEFYILCRILCRMQVSEARRQPLGIPL